jgi:hypothetical protein
MTKTTFTWRINALERTTADGIVTTVHYTVDADDGVAYKAGAYGSIGLEPPAPDDTIPYAALFEELCIEWVKNALGAEQVAQVEATLQAQLDEQRAPSRAQGLPW